LVREAGDEAGEWEQVAHAGARDEDEMRCAPALVAGARRRRERHCRTGTVTWWMTARRGEMVCALRGQCSVHPSTPKIQFPCTGCREVSVVVVVLMSECCVVPTTLSMYWL
jgi:hypothetical protein